MKKPRQCVVPHGGANIAWMVLPIASNGPKITGQVGRVKE
jgi:hypothetical protein